MKNKKMKLEELKVQSFVTSMEKTQKQTIDGGMTPTVSVTLTYVSALTNASAIVSINNATATDDHGDSNVVCNSDMCYSAYGWWCNILK